ncbi:MULTISPECIES: RrF2 family transcriptional regulator [Lachnospiraceae]|jgi:Rrf2 family iron-sulfur cluster assembly transcriptional regulator|uniref:Rrf2 family transcriptional regulator n=1 Tax=Faecalicatena acetigenes TaxID=2981790 RepID=A0ABT2TDE0_9FIRM|nr:MULTISPECIES: Rrf2 family transcriptional regulator [Lachnospiraceae]MCU6748290.1 Rrf2 family transcriptional regulator [Faecalicatena acetigenes]RGT71478.1 Rrf2 family transcriptional regulator [Ruminococcus sp. AF18-22]SCI36153.1 Cysteine metabolism repressor [uncultured Clostridium sp.]
MKISTRGRYALRVMIDLARQSPDTYTPLNEIAARQNISEKYLENIIKTLVKQQFLTGLRGKKGGYRLTKQPDEYTVGSILRLTEGTLAPVSCVEECTPECPRQSVCPTHPLWKKLNSMITHYLDSVTLFDLMTADIDKGKDF